jgi:hypothetical protein
MTFFHEVTKNTKITKSSFGNACFVCFVILRVFVKI